LALAAEHVKLHGGTLSVESVEPHGARFVVQLPSLPADGRLDEVDP
jgi:signal transduction histidine kinase